MLPLERLNYYPGQRLDAVDLNLESTYEMAVRRLLNQGLFTAGVVSGLEVTKTGPREVTVATGLALDSKGRELYLAEGAPLALPNQKPTGGGDSYYLLITYDEKKVQASDGACGPQDGGKVFSRIRETPMLAFSADWPNPKLCSDAFPDLNCGIVLATVTLDNSCQIASIDTGVRQYSYPTHSSQIHEAAFEGEKDIAPGEPKRLFFHVRGGAPTGVILYLRGGRFSHLYYTELGQHKHTFTAVSGTKTGASSRANVSLVHTHGMPGSNQPNQTGASGIHNHGIWTEKPTALSFTYESVATAPLSGSGYWDHNVSFPDEKPEPSWIGTPTKPDGKGTPAPNHTHAMGAANPASAAMDHDHSFDASGAQIGDFGVSDVAARGGPTELAFAFISDMQVTLDGIDVTANILRQLNWTTPLGGTAFNSDAGTGGIDLLRLPPVTGQPPAPVINEGEHILEFSVKKDGGKLLYNLYVE